MSAFEVVLLAAAVVFLVVAAVEATRFALRYRHTTWRRNREGRHLMRFTVALALALWGTLVLSVVPLPNWLELVIGAGIYAWLAFELHHRNRLLTWNQAEKSAPCPVCGAAADEVCGVDAGGREFVHVTALPEAALSPA